MQSSSVNAEFQHQGQEHKLQGAAVRDTAGLNVMYSWKFASVAAHSEETAVAISLLKQIKPGDAKSLVG